MKKVMVILLGLFILFGCGNNQEESKPDNQVENKKTQEVALDAVEEGLQISGAWVRPAAKNRNTGIFFRVINNTSENDTLESAHTNIAEKTEVHETYMKGEDMMGMREVEHIAVEAGKVFVFKPMSYHVMLINLKEDLTAGKEVELTLSFKNAGEIKVTAVVEDKMPSMKAAEEKDKMDM